VLQLGHLLESELRLYGFGSAWEKYRSDLAGTCMHASWKLRELLYAYRAHAAAKDFKVVEALQIYIIHDITYLRNYCLCCTKLPPHDSSMPSTFQLPFAPQVKIDYKATEVT